MTVQPGGAGVQDHSIKEVLKITAFRRLWLSLGLSSFGDWLGLLATTAMAARLGGESSYAAANLAVSGVLILRLAPAVLFGPLAGVLADRFDRKITMVVGDLLRFVLFVSIPVVGELWWLFVATVLVEIIGLFWMPAKDATVPNLVPRGRLEAANQLSLATTYGSAPVAALLFALLSAAAGYLNKLFPWLGSATDAALYANALTYLVAAGVIWKLDMPRRPLSSEGGAPAATSVWRSIVDGWAFVGGTPLVRGLVVGMLGAFGAGGFVIGVAPIFAADLGAGPSGYGVLFASVFTGLAAGMWVGPRLLAEFTRWRLFSLSIVVAGLWLALIAIIPNIVLAVLFAALLGAGAGIAWVTGYTLLGLEVADEMRGRTFAFVNSAARVVLVGVMALAPALAALIGPRTFPLGNGMQVSYNGTAFTLLAGALLAVGIGLLSYRTMDDHTSLPLTEDLVAAWQRRHVAAVPLASAPDHPGFFVAFEGGDGAGKSSQLVLLKAWLDELGHQVLLTREPGATELGRKIREVVLHGGQLEPRAEALLFAADRAQHVATVVLPALRDGAVVVTDRYVDSSVAYQGAGRGFDPDGIAQISRWATGSLLPDLTVVLDIDPSVARLRQQQAGIEPDRLEGEDATFHARVRHAFLAVARRTPRRYLVLDATLDPQVIATQVRERLEPMLPLSGAQQEEAVREQQERERQQAEQERAAAERERLEVERQRLEAERRRAETERRRVSEREAAARAADQQAEHRAREQAVRAQSERIAAEQAAEQKAAKAALEQNARAHRAAVEAKAHEEALRRQRRAGGADQSTTAQLPVVPQVPDPTTKLDLGEELFSLRKKRPDRRE